MAGDVPFSVVAGIDVHRDTFVVTVRRLGSKGRPEHLTRTFETFYQDMLLLDAFLSEQGVEAVGLESTGVYWKALVRVLRQCSPGRSVWVLNPADVRQRPGRKTDVSDSQWLAQLVMTADLTPSFVPPEAQDALRVLTRWRRTLVEQRTTLHNRILKELEASGLKLATLMTDVLGKSGRAMLEGLLAGGKTPAELAELARGRLRAKVPQLERALAMPLRDGSRLLLRQLLAQYDQLQTHLSEVDAELSTRLEPWAKELSLLQTIPGVGPTTAAAVLAEAGPDMSVFASSAHLASWAGVAPGNCESAGKRKDSPTRDGNRWLRTALVQASWCAVRKNGTYWGRKFRQLAVRLGPQQAIVAIARHMVVAAYHILRGQVPYADPAPRPLSEPKRRKAVERHVEQLQQLGFDVTITPKAA